MAQPYFSVIIVNCNYGRFLGQGIDSVLGQDFPAADREIIVVDDGSTDDSIAVVESFKDKVRLLRQKNQKQAGAFQTGFKAARGEVFCLLDADDYCHPDKLKSVAERLKDPRVGMVQHYLQDVDGQGHSLGNPLPRWPDKYTLDNFLDGRCEDAATSGLAFRRDVLLKALPVPADIFCWYDEFLIAHCLFHADMGNIPRVLGYHRIHGANNWAQRLARPDLMEGYVRQGRLFFGSLEPRLKEAGLELTPRFRRSIDIDFKRSEILAATSRGQRGKAFSAWRQLAAAHGGTGVGAFRSALLLLAVVHPAIYMGLYRFYSSSDLFRKTRDKLIPDR